MDFVDRVFQGETQQNRQQRNFGLTTAVVTGVMDDGTYELRFLSSVDDAPSAPARVMMPTAGNKRGLYAFPDVGDEVVVGFERGEPNMPIILGSLFNNESPPPDQAKPSSDNNVRTLVSRSGHEVTLDDSPGSESVQIKSQGGHELKLDDTPPGKITLKTAGGIELELDDATQTLTIRAPLNIKIETGGGSGLSVSSSAAGTLAINSPIAISLQSQGVISLQATSISLTTTGNQSASLVSIEGKPFGAHIHTGVTSGLGVTGPVSP
ncbi:MAG TPA: phage baseplate assembly protein V [Polyangia bacterium]|jgi:uncharacterized protein involved in type VI secretion and phage assembly|nr:phage baseplate assembly protein V [Polyangia bacterium]